MELSYETLGLMRKFHGGWNLLMAAGFYLQGMMGLKIRRARKRGGPTPANVVKTHRRLGPILAILGITGYFVGLTTTILGDDSPRDYPLHLLAGSTLILGILSLYIISRRIRGLQDPSRDIHFSIGLAVLILYPIQVTLGLIILLGS